MKRFWRVALIVVFSVGLLGLVSSPAAAAVINKWNVGVTEPAGFIATNNPDFPGGFAETAMWMEYADPTLEVDRDGDDFVVNYLEGPLVFCFHLGYFAGFADDGSPFGEGFTRSDLHIKMNVVAPDGVTTVSDYDMRGAPNNNVTGNLPFLLGFPNPPQLFIQNKIPFQEVPWIIGADPSVLGTYSFTLTAVEGDSELSLTMYVRVVPAPGAVGFLGLASLLALRRRR